MKRNIVFRIPGSVNIDDLYERRPRGVRKKDHIAYVLDLITRVAARNKKYVDVHGFTRITREYLKRAIGNYKPLLDYLEREGIIESNRHYVVGEFSSGLRLTERHQLGQMVAYIPTSRVFIRALEKPNRTPDKFLLPRHTLRNYSPYWYYYEMEWETARYSQMMHEKLGFLLQHLQKIDIDRPKALEVVHKLETVELESGLFLREDACRRMNSREHTVLSISDEAPWMKIDGTTGRCHTPITSLPKYLRSFLAVGGRRLVSIDVKSSQPLLALCLLNRETMEEKGLIDLLAVYNPSLLMPYPFTDDRHRRDHRSEVLSYIEANETNEDVALYRSLVTEGDLYRVFGERLIQEKAVEEVRMEAAREVGKAAMMNALFGYKYQLERGGVGKVLRALFPTLHQVLVLLKTGGEGAHACVSCALQHVEAVLILEEVCRTMNAQNPQVPLITVHDSIATTEENVEALEDLMKRVITDYVGALPQLRREPWYTEEEDPIGEALTIAKNRLAHEQGSSEIREHQASR